MKYISLLSLFLGLPILNSCTNDIEDVKGENTQPFTPLIVSAISDSINEQDQSTRAYGEFSYKVKWNKNDLIAISDNINSGTLILDSGEDSTVGIFTQEDGDTKQWTGSVTGYYPASILSGVNTYSWPSVQNNALKFTEMPMISHATISADNKTNFIFNGLGGVIQAMFYTTVPGVILKEVSVKAENAGLSGDFTIENDVAKITNKETEVKVVFDGDGLDITKGYRNVYFQLPATPKTKLTFTLVALDGREGTTEATAPVDYRKVSRMPRQVDNFGYLLPYFYWDGDDKKEGHGIAKGPVVDYSSYGKSLLEDTQLPEILNLVSVTLPSNITTLGDMTYFGEESLEEVNLNEGLVAIGSSCFEDAFSLQSIEIPSTVMYIGEGAFQSCEDLTEITFLSETPPGFGRAVFAECAREQGNTLSVTVPSTDAAELYATALNDIDGIYGLTIEIYVADMVAGNGANNAYKTIAPKQDPNNSN